MFCQLMIARLSVQINGKTKLVLSEGSKGIPENAFINVKNTSLSITADVEVQDSSSGVLLCQGGDFGGWSLYMKNGRPHYTYNWVGIESYTVAADQAVGSGKHTVKFDFDYDGGRGAGGTGTIYIDGVKAGQGKIKNTNSNAFGIDESADVGVDENTPVVPAYGFHNKFTGKIKRVVVETYPVRKQGRAVF